MGRGGILGRLGVGAGSGVASEHRCARCVFPLGHIADGGLLTISSEVFVSSCS